MIKAGIFSMLLSDTHYQQNAVLMHPIPCLIITFPIYLASHYSKYDYRVSTEYENDEEALSQDLCTKIGPTIQLKIYQSWLCRTNILQLFVFSELIYFEIWFCLNGSEIYHYQQCSFLCSLYLQIWLFRSCHLSCPWNFRSVWFLPISLETQQYLTFVPILGNLKSKQWFLLVVLIFYYSKL